MKRILIHAIFALITFVLGIAAAAVWIKSPSADPKSVSTCAPRYDENFEELPLYALPDCVDEAYSLTWIPSFDSPVFVRVWHSGDQAFMVAKRLDNKGWSKFGKVKEFNSRPLTNFEWRDFTDLLNRNSYWDLSSTVDEMSPEDGALWLVDGLRSGKFHSVRRRVPNESYAEICKHLIRLSGLETAHALYLP